MRRPYRDEAVSLICAMKIPMTLALRIVMLGIALCTSALAQDRSAVINSEKHSFRLVTLLPGLENPWSVAFLPDGRMLVTERAGRLRLVGQDFRLDPKPIAGLPDVVSQGQGGLFDVVLHPEYAQNGWIYWAYNAPGAGGWGTALARGKLQGLRMTEVQVLFSMQPKTRSSQHFGGRIVFDRAGMLYLTLGDRGDKDRAQKLDDHAGSVIRLHDDGRVPADNPFAKRAGALPEKWTLGNRNMQGAALHPKTGELWTHEHGPQGGDEVNVMRSGLNYGWPVITYGVDYSGAPISMENKRDGMEQPLVYWVPSIAPSSMVLYTGNLFPQWKGDLLVSALAGQQIRRLDLENGAVKAQETLLAEREERYRAIIQAPDGSLIVLTDDPEGKVLRLSPN